ncbi:hypothetical protein C2E21_6647 [Chlorella sorokiniana]|uniref:Secreted protein n=1 Tax=Chlorella sorokiniana TaxID=3076 RepID=A0A2P6TK62_CHLSO|nr:hypothetical protein C2E21_6647 [Chlorella sorokiniana]|eukprot:PRW44470.1 hypothetical protein C2E21_6647 [Chlorella sorokiniana]
MTLRKFLAILLVCLACAGAASAHGFPWESSPAIRKCVRDRQCWTKGTTAVCGKTWGPRGPITYGFPNRCYYACVNFNQGEKWQIKKWYDAGDRCNQQWTERCSRC